MKFKQATRNAYASHSSGASYPSKGEAVSCFNHVLRQLGVLLDPAQTIQMYGDEGRLNVRIVALDDNGDETDREEGWAVLTWYRRNDAAWEVVSYLA